MDKQMHMENPAEDATSENPHHVTLDGKDFYLWTTPAATAMGERAEPRRTTMWVVSVDGGQHTGWPWSIEDSKEDIDRDLAAWWREKNAAP